MDKVYDLTVRIWGERFGVRIWKDVNPWEVTNPPEKYRDTIRGIANNWKGDAQALAEHLLEVFALSACEVIEQGIQDEFIGVVVYDKEDWT